MVGGILALDLDGVISDTWTGILRHEHNIPAETQPFIDANPDIVGRTNSKLNPYDVKSVQYNSVLLIAELIHQCNLGVIIVSSWATSLNPDCYKQVFKLFQYVYSDLKEEQWLGQSCGVGGRMREDRFLNIVRDRFDKDDPKYIIAIDDSGIKHFPKLVYNTVAPIGRLGFTVDDYIKAIRILDYDDEQWYDWSYHGYVESLSKSFKAAPKDELWLDIFNDTLK